MTALRPRVLSKEEAARVQRCKLAFELGCRLDIDRHAANKLADRVAFVQWLRKKGKA